MSAVFSIITDYGTFGNIGNDKLKAALVKVDDFPPRLHIGRWTPDGRHVRFAGFITTEQARALGKLLSNAEI